MNYKFKWFQNLKSIAKKNEYVTLMSFFWDFHNAHDNHSKNKRF